LAVLDDQCRPAAHLGVEVYDRRTRYDGEGPEGPRILATFDRRSMGLAYVVDPERWRQGFGRAALRAVMETPETSDADLFVAGIDADNTASRRCTVGDEAGPEGKEPDREGIIYHIGDRP